MNKPIIYPVAIICTFIWIGFVCAISFMEAWLKFQAPGITVPLGLGIGRLVFNALNKVEWVLAIGILFNLTTAKVNPLAIRQWGYWMAVLLVALQSGWLLPELDARAALHIEGSVVANSNLHFYYVAAEVIKVLSLFVFGILLFGKAPIKVQQS